MICVSIFYMSIFTYNYIRQKQITRTDEKYVRRNIDSHFAYIYLVRIYSSQFSTLPTLFQQSKE